MSPYKQDFLLPNGSYDCDRTLGGYEQITFGWSADGGGKYDADYTSQSIYCN